MKVYNEMEFSQWSVYDDMIQSYRSNMISSQSLLLAVAALFFSASTPESNTMTIVVCIIGLINQWFIWHRVIRARSFVADFHKHNAKYELSLNINEDGEILKEGDTPLTEHTYTTNRSVRKKANKWVAEKSNQIKFKRNYRTTRVKLDIILPIMFTIIWGMTLYLSLKQKLPNLPNIF